MPRQGSLRDHATLPFVRTASLMPRIIQALALSLEGRLSTAVLVFLWECHTSSNSPNSCGRGVHTRLSYQCLEALLPFSKQVPFNPAAGGSDSSCPSVASHEATTSRSIACHRLRVALMWLNYKRRSSIHTSRVFGMLSPLVCGKVDCSVALVGR